MPEETREQWEGPQGLDSARVRIDALDDALLELIERRLAASAAIAASKSAEDHDHLWLRPRREAAIITRLSNRAAAVPPGMIEQIWRELMAWSLQTQVRLELVVHADDPARLTPALRRRFGWAAPLRHVATAAEALEAAGTQQAVAILACDQVPASLPDRLFVFDWISDESGRPVAAAIGRISPDELPESCK